MRSRNDRTYSDIGIAGLHCGAPCAARRSVLPWPTGGGDTSPFPEDRAMHRLLAVAALVLASLVPAAASAQAWPARPIRVIVPYPPGGTSDILARSSRDKLAQPRPADRRREQAGRDRQRRRGVRREVAARRLHAAAGRHRRARDQPELYPKLPFDPVKDFAPVIDGRVLAAHPRGASVGAGAGPRRSSSRSRRRSPASSTSRSRASAARSTSPASTSRCAPASSGPTSRTRAARRRSPTWSGARRT